MNEPAKKPSLITSNQMLRNIQKSLRHLQLREQNQQKQQSDVLTFQQNHGTVEQQTYSSNSQNATSERSRLTKAYTLEEIRKDLKPFAANNGLVSPLNSTGSKFHNLKSSSVSDLHQATKELNHINVKKQKIALLVSYGYDEVMATEIIQNNTNKSIDTLMEMLNAASGAQTNKITSRSHHALPNPLYQPSQRYANTRQHYYQQYDPSTRSYLSKDISTPPPMQRQLSRESELRQYHQGYMTNSKPQSVYAATETNKNTISDRHGQAFEIENGGLKHQVGDNLPHNMFDTSHIRPVEQSLMMYENMQGVDIMHPKYNGVVTKRIKNNERKINPQNRWSADVLHENVPNKPPPPYPGFSVNKKPDNVQQPGWKQRPVDANTLRPNSPVTVIFDEKNDKVNVVKGIPEPFDNATLHRSPRSKLSRFNMFPKPGEQFNLSTDFGGIHPSFSPNSILPTKNDALFRPIEDHRVAGRRSPPPYPGSTFQRPSNRNSLNIDETENNPSHSMYYFSDGSSSSNKTSEPSSVVLSDSSASTSPVPDAMECSDDVERSYSPLPTLPTNSPYHTMVVRTDEEIKEEPAQTDSEHDKDSLRLKNCTPQACKFYLEQHFENLLKRQDQRKHRREQLEVEMTRAGLPGQAQEEMRKMLNKKESNYIRLRRAKMDKTMFSKIQIIGIGAFGEVSLVRRNGTVAYYAMKTLNKSEVLRKNQVAHVKAERDILAEADNEWVVKLYYSFQDQHNLYFVMDYVPGGDLMALLIKLSVFEENLALFYIAELVLAIESVHKLGFIHRDIKPDNVLIDRNGHIKLTDFGLCTGFRWTHDSKYYQPETEIGGHSRQFSMEPEGGWESMINDVDCNCNNRLQFDLYKPLERRKLRRHMRCQAHSLVGTPNYIAPEVLLRVPYSQQCDWWSVGVILYEMLIGQPPFFASSPLETQRKVIRWNDTLTIRKNIPRDSEDIILKLLSSADKRIGRNGADEIKSHPYFRGVNFNTIHEEKAPFIPVIKNATDTSNFDPVPEDLSNSCGPEEACSDENDREDGPVYAFYEFTFRHFFDDGGHANPVFERKDGPKPRALSHAKRSATKSNNSMSVPNKVPAPNVSMLEEKEPIFV